MDLQITKLKWWEVLRLILLPTYIQLADEHVVYFKLWRGRMYVMKMIERNTNAYKETR